MVSLQENVITKLQQLLCFPKKHEKEKR